MSLGKAIITFSDTKDGHVCVKLEFDPPLDNENDRATPAQIMMLEKWEALNAMDEELD